MVTWPLGPLTTYGTILMYALGDPGRRTGRATRVEGRRTDPEHLIHYSGEGDEKFSGSSSCEPDTPATGEPDGCNEYGSATSLSDAG